MTFPFGEPEDPRTLPGRATGGGGTPDPTIPPKTPPTEPPGTPPTTPPVTPVLGAGASSSTILVMFLGILLGVRSSPFTISLTCTTLWTCGGAVGGGR